MKFTRVNAMLSLAFAILSLRIGVTAESARVAFRPDGDQLRITVDDRPIATYVINDTKILRPYFANVRTLDGIQVTRRHPPIDGQDRTDHDTMHPGIWLAFGDLNGHDFWRNQARVVHLSFTEGPHSGTNRGSFVEDKLYLAFDNQPICHERFSFSVHLRPVGYFLSWDSTFYSDSTFYFGDQEEMGLGVRMATPLAEINGGKLNDSQDRKSAKAIWSNSAEWSDYSGIEADQRIGVTLMSHPDNFRKSWLHARDYGLMVANPFGRKAMKKGETSKIVVQPGERFRIRFGLWIHGDSADTASDSDQVYAEYVKNSRVEK